MQLCLPSGVDFAACWEERERGLLHLTKPTLCFVLLDAESSLQVLFLKFQLGGPGASLTDWERHQVVNITRSDFRTEPTARAP